MSDEVWFPEEDEWFPEIKSPLPVSLPSKGHKDSREDMGAVPKLFGSHYCGPIIKTATDGLYHCVIYEDGCKRERWGKIWI